MKEKPKFQKRQDTEDEVIAPTMTPQEELKKAEEMQGRSGTEYRDAYFNPVKNPDAISIVLQADGNYKGWSQRNGKLIEVRTVKPEDALGELLTTG